MTKRPGIAHDPLWYKDAIIYETHVRAFFDEDDDGVGDFAGLTRKLDYVADLGVTCVSLLPFFPSPWHDDGYDIADYSAVHPALGTLQDFQTFLDQAHERGLQVLVELVLNHTSDEHAWFRQARAAPAGSAARDYYVWSETQRPYGNAPVTLSGTDRSSWTWDPEASAYYGHRFSARQPDLNFDNPSLVTALMDVLSGWLDRGVDALRLDGIPYAIGRDGTPRENLPETHAIVKQIRSGIDRRYANRVIVAGANLWPPDVRPYFGDDDECHIASHGAIMPRLFMALRLEDATPIADILAQTPEIPPGSQWGLMLRNHDEMTLRMVTDEERDYMYVTYSAEPRLRFNSGKRRRLAPLADNDRRRIELLNSLLFSLPGTPMLYYGDEIGMGDNIYLGGRAGVRTPMQWSADRNAGFSRADPARLYSPVIVDPVYGYEVVNAEAQRRDPSSLLNWMRNTMSLRRRLNVFGRGSMEVLPVSNRKVFAYLRRHGDACVLCVANLSRRVQPVGLDLSRFAGWRPTELSGDIQFPSIGRETYQVTLGPYGFLWLGLQPAGEHISVRTEAPLAAIGPNWEGVLPGAGASQAPSLALAPFLRRQRWFAERTSEIRSVSVADGAEIVANRAVGLIVHVSLEPDGRLDRYFVPLAFTAGEAADRLLELNPGVVLQRAEMAGQRGVLYDGMHDEVCRRTLLDCIATGRRIPTAHGAIVGCPGTDVAAYVGPDVAGLASRAAGGEQSNTSAFFGDRVVLKIYRRPADGIQPEREVGQFLTERARFTAVSPYLGHLQHERTGHPVTTLGLLQGFVPNEGDAWPWMLDELERYYEYSAAVPPQRPVSGALFDAWVAGIVAPLARERLALSLEAATGLGLRTAEMHLALAVADDDPAFAPEPLDVKALAGEMAGGARTALDALSGAAAGLPKETQDEAKEVLARRHALLTTFEELKRSAGLLRSRVHGDYHLGQVLRSRGDFIIIDFEGEPKRSPEERRAKHSPLKDVAGMLASIAYAAHAALLSYTRRRPESWARLEPAARLWLEGMGAAFLAAYRGRASGSPIIPAEDGAFGLTLKAYLLDKSMYELRYELDHRPGWLRVPLKNIIAFDSGAP